MPHKYIHARGTASATCIGLLYSVQCIVIQLARLGKVAIFSNLQVLQIVCMLEYSFQCISHSVVLVSARFEVYIYISEISGDHAY